MHVFDESWLAKFSSKCHGNTSDDAKSNQVTLTFYSPDTEDKNAATQRSIKVFHFANDAALFNSNFTAYSTPWYSIMQHILYKLNVFHIWLKLLIIPLINKLGTG